jgi:hypothetical protein
MGVQYSVTTFTIVHHILWGNVTRTYMGLVNSAPTTHHLHWLASSIACCTTGLALASLRASEDGHLSKIGENTMEKKEHLEYITPPTHQHTYVYIYILYSMFNIQYSIFMFIYLSLSLSLSIYLSIHPSIYLSIIYLYLSNLISSYRTLSNII